MSDCPTLGCDLPSGHVGRCRPTTRCAVPNCNRLREPRSANCQVHEPDGPARTLYGGAE